MSARLLSVVPLTGAAFAPFGQVIECADHAGQTINDGSCERFTDLAHLEVDAAGRLALSLFRARARALPQPLRCLERHPLGSQTFVPMDRQAFLVVVSPDPPTPDNLRAFLCTGGRGVNLRAGLWHHPLLALSDGDFLVADRLGPGDNCEVIDIADWRIGVASP